MNTVNLPVIDLEGRVIRRDLYNEGTEVIKSEHLPSYVDDVVEYDSVSDFPATGESGKIYVAKDTGKTYRWSGSQYVLVSSPSSEDITYDGSIESHASGSVGDKLSTLSIEVEGKADKTPVATPASASSYELAVDTLTNLGTLSSAVTLTLATAPSDGKVHSYDAIFTTGSTAPTITWPSGMAWLGGNVPTINAGKTYEVSIVNNLAVCGEFAVPNA